MPLYGHLFLMLLLLLLLATTTVVCNNESVLKWDCVNSRIVTPPLPHHHGLWVRHCVHIPPPFFDDAFLFQPLFLLILATTAPAAHHYYSWVGPSVCGVSQTVVKIWMQIVLLWLAGVLLRRMPKRYNIGSMRRQWHSISLSGKTSIGVYFWGKNV